jgi:hypothetical protein
MEIPAGYTPKVLYILNMIYFKNFNNIIEAFAAINFTIDILPNDNIKIVSYKETIHTPYVIQCIKPYFI